MADEPTIVSNDNAKLSPVTEFSGRLLRFEMDGLKIGVAEYDEGPTKIAAFTVVNASGAIVDRGGRVVRGHLDKETGKRFTYQQLLNRAYTPDTKPGAPGHNTTLTVVVTNQKLANMRQVARQVHSSMARAIDPFHTFADGDILYFASTRELENPNFGDASVGVAASDLAWDATLNCFEP